MVEKIKNSLLPTLSVRRPVTVMMVLLCALVLGLIAYLKIGMQILPSGADNPRLTLETRMSSHSSPYETETRVTRPLEEGLRTVPGIKRVASRSRAWDSSIYLRFDQRTDMKQAYAQVRDRIERTMPLLPESVRRVKIRKFNEGADIPILYFSFNTPADEDDPYHFAETMIKRRLERIDGVAMIQFWGPQEKSIFIDLDKQKLISLRLGVYQLRNQLLKDNFALSSGYITEGGRRHLVRSLARFGSLDEIRGLPVRAADGKRFKLSDVATVSYRTAKEYFELRRDGVTAIMMGVWKESMANTVEISETVERVLTEELPRQAGLAGIDFQVYLNQGKHILEAIGNIEQTCLWGGLFAVLILLFFLRSWKMTGIITLAIPLSLMITVVVMYFTGWTLNLITMMGMMISIGLVVDNSIVVVENIFRLRQEGVDGVTAAIKGASEVSLAITLSTLTTVVVFLPLMLMGEDKMFTFYMIRIGLPVIVALVGSLLVALYFIPLGTVKMPPRKLRSERRLITWLKARYQRVLIWCLAHRLDTAILLILLLASSVIPLGTISKIDYSEMERDQINIVIMPPNYYSWEQSKTMHEQLEDFLTRRKQRYGLESITVRHWHLWGNIELFRPVARRTWYEIAYRNIRNGLGVPVDSVMSYRDVVAELRDSLPSFPDVRTRVNWSSQDESDPALNMVIYGDDSATLVEIARELQRRLLAVEGLSSVEIDLERGLEEIQVGFDRETAHRYGLDARQIASTVSLAGSEVRLREFRSSDKEIRTIMRFSNADSTSLQELASMPVYTPEGQQVSLGTLASFTIRKGQGQINRENGKTYIGIKTTANKKHSKDLFARVSEVMAGMEMPQGYSWNRGWGVQQMEERKSTQMFGVLAGVIFVFLIMGLLFESFVLPLCVIIAIPFSFCGSFWALYLTGTQMDIMSQIGLIIMIGVVVNNAIVLVDTIRQYRDRGLDRTTALLEAGAHRFRPILMTAATTIGGLIPMAVGGARMLDISYTPMGRTMIGGLITSTLVTLVAVPLLYTFFDDLRNYTGRLTDSFWGRTRHEGVESTDTANMNP